MSDVETHHPDAAYLTKPNIVAPYPSTAAATAAEANAQTLIAARKRTTAVSGGTIKRGS